MKPLAISLFCWAAALSAASRAQDVLEEIVVTARFRDTALNRTAGSGTVVDEAEIRARAAEHVESVLNAVPNVDFSGGASRARFVQVRGVGDLEQFVDPKHFPSVGIAVDSIDLGSAASAAMLLDVEQVEVLRGPQGTNFGTSALGGLVNLHGRRPTREFESTVEVGVGNYGRSMVSGIASGRLSETVAARAAVRKSSSDGYIDNVYLGRDDTNGFDETAARGVLEVTPNEHSEYGLTALYYDGDNGYDAFSLANTRETISDAPGHDRQRTTALSGTARWEIGSLAALELVATWLDSDLDYGFDEDWTYVGYCDGTLCDPVLDFFSNTDRYLRDRTQTSFDARVLGSFGASGDGGRRYVLGLYADRRNEDLHREYYGDFFSGYEANRLAVYGEIKLPLADRMNFTAGLRVERFDDNYDDSFGFASDSGDTLGNGELTLDLAVGSDTFVYGTLSRGEKAGGVNTEASANLPFMQPQFQDFLRPRLGIRTERLTNTEVGVKGSYRDGRLNARIALFHMNRHDAQLESWIWDGVNYLWIGFLDNVNGTNWGAEAEIDYVLESGPRIFAALGLLDTEVDAMTVFDLDRGEFRLREGIEQAKAPNWQYHLGIEAGLSQRTSLRFEVEGRDDSRFGYYHDGSIAAYHLVNASFEIELANSELQLWGRNLTDKDYAVHGLYFGNDPRKGWVNETYYQFGEPRVAGITWRYHFR